MCTSIDEDHGSIGISYLELGNVFDAVLHQCYFGNKNDFMIILVLIPMYEGHKSVVLKNEIRLRDEATKRHLKLNINKCGIVHDGKSKDHCVYRV